MKVLNETDDDMQTVTLTKKQCIAKLFRKRIDKNTKEYQFIDQNDHLIIGLQYFWPQPKDQFGRYKDDSDQYSISEGTILVYLACEHHENHLNYLICNPICL